MKIDNLSIRKSLDNIILPRIAYYGDKWHFYIYNTENKKDGFRLKRRTANNIWVHYNFIVFRKNRTRDANRNRDRALSRRHKGKWLIRPSLTIFEFSSWKTIGAEHGTRINSKGYLRIKACLPGKEICDDIQSAQIPVEKS